LFKILCAKTFSFCGASGALSLNPTGGLPSAELPDWPVFILGLSGGNSPSKISEIPLQKKFNETEEPEAQIHGWMTLTKKFGPDLPLLFKLHEIWSVDSHENH